MARNMITGKETQKMQEFTQEQIDRAEHMEIEIPADVKEQIFEYANLIGEEEKVRTLVKNLTDAINQADEDKVEELLDDAKMDIQDLPDPTIGKLELRDYGYKAEDMVPLRKEVAYNEFNTLIRESKTRNTEDRGENKEETEHERDHLQPEWRVPDSGYQSGGDERNDREVRIDEERVSEKPQSSQIQHSDLTEPSGQSSDGLSLIHI